MQGGAELEKPAGLEPSAQTRSSLVCLGPLTHSHPVPPRGWDPQPGETSGEGESAWALSWD